jgi:hypothetical protein
MNAFDMQPDPMVLTQGELRALIEQTTGSVTDLRLCLIDQRGQFAWTGTAEAITGTCKVTFTATDAGIAVEIAATVDAGS